MPFSDYDFKNQDELCKMLANVELLYVFFIMGVPSMASQSFSANWLKGQKESKNFGMMLPYNHQEDRLTRLKHETRNHIITAISLKDIEGIVNSTELRFCKCGPNFVSTLQGCQPFNTTIELHVINRAKPLLINTTDIKSKIGLPVCGKLKSLLHFPRGSFYVISGKKGGGRLMIGNVDLTTYPSDHFCIEHVYYGPIDRTHVENFDPDLLSLEAKICVKNIMSKCCEENGITDSLVSSNRDLCKSKLASAHTLTGKETSITSKPSVQPSIKFGKQNIFWNFTNALLSSIQCLAGSQLTKILLRKEHVQFYYLPKSGTIMKLPSGKFHVDYKHDEFCIEKEDDNFFIYFCYIDLNKRKSPLFPSFFPKCCPEYQIFFEDQRGCAPHLNSQKYFFKLIQLFRNLYRNSVFENNNSNSSQNDMVILNTTKIENSFNNTKILYGVPQCVYLNLDISSKDVALFANNSLLYKNKTFPSGSFCIEMISPSQV